MDICSVMRRKIHCNVFTQAHMHECKHKCMHNTLTELLFQNKKFVVCGFVRFIVYKCAMHIQSYLYSQRHTVPTCMVCFSSEQESAVTLTQYGRFDESQGSLMKVPLMCLQDFPGNAFISPKADWNLIDRERVVDSVLSFASLNQYMLSIECMTYCVEKLVVGIAQDISISKTLAGSFLITEPSSYSSNILNIA